MGFSSGGGSFGSPATFIKNTMDALLISTTLPHFDNLVGWTYQALGRSIAEQADHKRLQGVEKYAVCLRELGADPTHFIHLGFQIIADERDMVDILQIIALPFAEVETVRRGYSYALVSGSLGAWRKAVAGGLHSDFKALFVSIDNQIRALNIDTQLRIA